MSFDESGFIGLKIFFWVQIIWIFFDLMSLSFFAVVYTLLQVVLHDVHFCDYALYTYQLVRQLAGHTPRSDEVRAQVAFKTDVEVLDFILESSLLLAL